MKVSGGVVAGFFGTIPAGSLRTLDHSVIAGKKYTDVRDTREWVRQQSFSRLIAHTRDYWRHWLGQSPETLPGIGPVRRKALLRRFGSVAGVKQASVEEIAVIENIGAELARTIVTHLRDGE